MANDDAKSLALESVSSGWAITPGTSIHTGQSTDEFELVADSDPGNEEDDSDDVDTRSTSTTSVSSSVYEHEYELGRRYHSFKSGRYPFPNDMAEQNREEVLHAMMLELTSGHLFFSDVGEWPQKIIDIGTGLGLWTVDVADMYPGASVVGTDLSPIQPTWLPVNLRMFVEDCEDPDWSHGAGFDLVHLRGVAGMLRDLDAVLRKVHSQMTTGGWIEFQDLENAIYCDDDSMSHSDPLRAIFKLGTKGIREFGCRAYPRLPQDLYTSLSSAEFSNIQIVTKKVPIGAWAKEKKLRTVGVFAKELVSETIEALAAKPLVALDLLPGERRTMLTMAKKSLENPEPRRYMKMHFVYAQKVEAARSDTESFLSYDSAWN